MLVRTAHSIPETPIRVCRLNKLQLQHRPAIKLVYYCTFVQRSTSTYCTYIRMHA